MNPAAIQAHLDHVERHIRDGGRHLLRQRETVDELERHGRGNSQTAKMAREILDTFEEAQSAHLNDPRASPTSVGGDNIDARNGEPPLPAAVVCTA